MSSGYGNDVPRLALVAFALALLCGCRQSESQPQSESQFDESYQSMVFDLGKVSIEAGPQDVSHVFNVTNDSDEVIEIVDIKKSCGCVDAQLKNRRLEPGQSTTLQITLNLSTTGRIEHGATLMLSNGHIRSFRLAAHGTLRQELTPILPTPYFDPDSGQLAVRLYLIADSGKVETAPPVVADPAGVTLTFEGWNTLERQTKLKVRPTRQIGTTFLNFTQYRGEYPVTVTLRTEGGVECTLTALGPRPTS